MLKTDIENYCITFHRTNSILFGSSEAVFEIVKELSCYGDTEEGKSEELAEQCKLEGSKVSCLVKGF